MQLALVILAVLLASAYLSYGIWRSLSGSGCGGGCGQQAKSGRRPLIAANELTARLRAKNRSNR